MSLIISFDLDPKQNPFRSSIWALRDTTYQKFWHYWTANIMNKKILDLTFFLHVPIMELWICWAGTLLSQCRVVRRCFTAPIFEKVAFKKKQCGVSVLIVNALLIFYFPEWLFAGFFFFYLSILLEVGWWDLTKSDNPEPLQHLSYCSIVLKGYTFIMLLGWFLTPSMHSYPVILSLYRVATMNQW